MDRCLLKNIIILILLLVNGFLVGSLIMRHTATVQTQHQADEQLVALFASDGMELSPDLISRETPPSVISLSRDLEREREAAAFFLGENLEQTDMGGSHTYSSTTGTARFYPNGSFDIVGSLASAEEAETLCRRFCDAFSYQEPDLSQGGDGTFLSASQWEKYPVLNSGATFTLDQGALLTVSGTLLPEEGTATASEQQPLSASAALTAFQQARREGYIAASVITDMYLCYELQGSTASTLTLSPTWCIVTDAANHYVNCITGVVFSK